MRRRWLEPATGTSARWLLPLRKYGRGHVQMLVRGILTYCQALCTVALLANEVDLSHQWPLLFVQLVNGTSLCHQFLSNNSKHFLLRAISSSVNALSLLHLGSCGRRDPLAALIWDAGQGERELRARQARGYPLELGEDSMVCLSPGMLAAAGVEYLYPFRILHFLAVLAYLGLAYNLAGHWAWPARGAVFRAAGADASSSSDEESSDGGSSAEEGKAAPGERAEARAARAPGGGRAISPRGPGAGPPPAAGGCRAGAASGAEGERPSPAETPATQVVPIRGTTWLRGRMQLSLALALINVARAALKLTVIPEGSYFQRSSAETAVNFLRGVLLRPALAWSLLVQYYCPV